MTPRRFIVLVIFLLGFLLRLYNIRDVTFGFDQNQIVDASQSIVAGKPTLIGPRTGPAEMFTGPLIYYVATLFDLFISTRWAVLCSSLFFTFSAGIAIYFLSLRYVPKLSLYLLILWAFSPFLLVMDKIVWNPNIVLLASSLVFFPLLKKEKGREDLIFICCGIFLGYQGHFSGLLLFPLAIPFLKRIEHRFLAALSLFLSVLPTILFDLRHNWLNFRGLERLLFMSGQTGLSQFPSNLINKIYILVETQGKILFNGAHHIIIMIAGALVVVLFFYFQKRMPFLFQWWLGLIVVGYALYNESTPEYYFLVICPVLLYVLSFVIFKLNPSAKTK